MSEQQSPPGDAPAAPASIGADRADLGIDDLRSHTARGTLLNSGFDLGLAGLGFLQRTLTAIFVTRAEFGLWAVVLTILVNLAWLKQIGIMDKYVQQSEPDQERAFQKAFTLELLLSLAFFVVCAAVLPLWAAAYGHEEIILAGVVLAISVPLSAFETPSWIPYRRLQYRRQRMLLLVNPLVSFAVTIALGIAGTGYWCFIGGILAGCLTSAIVCTVTSPYRLRLTIDSTTLRTYATFSWPLLGAAVSKLVIIQGSLLIVNAVSGLGALGIIGFATAIAAFADRVDTLVSQTIYPAVCAVANRAELLFEIFVKSNRIALMWAMPFGAIAGLFAEDLVRFIFGDRWLPAVPMIQAFGLTCAFAQVAFNWALFQRATNQTRPIFFSAALDLLVFAFVSVPLMLTLGLTGYAIAFAATTTLQIGLRGFYMARMFPGFKVFSQLLRAVAPAVPGVLPVLALRAVESGNRTFAIAVGELLVYVVTTALCTWLLERDLVREVVGYVVRRSSRSAAVPVSP